MQGPETLFDDGFVIMYCGGIHIMREWCFSSLGKYIKLRAPRRV